MDTKRKESPLVKITRPYMEVWIEEQLYLYISYNRFPQTNQLTITTLLEIYVRNKTSYEESVQLYNTRKDLQSFMSRFERND